LYYFQEYLLYICIKIYIRMCVRSNVQQNLANKTILEIIEWQFIISNAGTHNCIVNANRSSTDDPRCNHVDRCVVSLLVSIPSSFPRAFPSYSLLWWAVKSCTSTPCKINRSPDRSVVRHFYSAFAGPDQCVWLMPGGL